MMATRRHWAGLAGALGLLVSVGALVAAFLASVDSASYHFRRAAIAQAQFAAVLRIQGRLAAPTVDRSALHDDLADYAALVARETALLPPRERPGQRLEARAAVTLARLATDPARAARVATLVTAVIEGERVEAAETTRDMEALRRRTAWIAALLALAAAGSALLGAVGLVSANRRLSRQVAARTAELVEVDRSRRLFFAKASHELRTPVTVMRGEAEVTLADPATPPALLRDALAQVVAQAEFLEHRLAELLGLAQAEEGRIVLIEAPFDLADAARAAVAASGGLARSLAVDLAVSLAPSPVHGDRRWVEQAIVAVLDNAIKFSPTLGTVAVAGQRVAGCAMLTVTDRGAGLAAEALPRIFDAYYQTDAGRARGGSGLGLALARWVVERHGGTIAAANLAEGGCAVTLSLPLEPDR